MSLYDCISILEEQKMTVWIVSIEEGDKPGDPAKFVPQLQRHGADGLRAASGDAVSWANRTDDVHEPWPTDQNYVPLSEAQVGPHGSTSYLSDEINPGRSSRPSWIVPKLTPPPPPPVIVYGNTVYYCCKLHPQERSKITITS
jgi:hypothetical protein